MTQYFILNDTRSGLHHGCEVVMQNLILYLQKNDQSAKIESLFTGQFLTENQWKDTLNYIDIVIINGEGTLHDAASYGLFLLTLGHKAKQAGKKVYLINSTWENNPKSWIEYIRDFDAISLRDLKSFNELKNDLSNNIYYAPDLTFFSSNLIKPNFSLIAKKIIINDSVYSNITNELFSYANLIKAEYHPITRLLPTQKSEPGYNKKKLKKLNTYKILSILSLNKFKPRRYYQDFTYAIDNTKDFKQKLLESDLVITGRYHCLCFCLQMHIPVLIVASNTSKTQNLLNDIGLKNRHIQLEELKKYSIEELYQRAKYSKNELEKLQRFNTEAKLLQTNILNKLCTTATENKI